MEITKELQDLILAHANPKEEGYEAFRRRDFVRCIELLSETLEREKNNFTARLAIALSYVAEHETLVGANHLRYILENCSDERLKVQAKLALTHAEEKLQQAAREQAAKKHYGSV